MTVALVLAAYMVVPAPPNAARIAEIAATLPERPAWTDSLPKANTAKADKLLAEPIPDCSDELYLLFTKTGNRTEYQKVYGQRMANLVALAAAAGKTGDKKYVDRVAEYIEAICSERAWTMPAHDSNLKNFKGKWISVDLGASHRAYGMAEALCLAGDRLPPAVVARARAEMERRVFAVYRRAALLDSVKATSDAGCWWFFGYSNWNAVCHSCIVRAALAVIEDRNDRAIFVEGAERGARCFFTGFLPDGYCTEGSGYWNYGYGHFLELTRAVRAATGGKVDFSKLNGARKPFEYGFGYRLLGGSAPDFADGGNRAPADNYLKIGVEFWPDLRPLLKGPPPPRTWFPNGQVYIGRAKDFAFGVKGGNNAELHNHNDVGSWSLMVGKLLVAGDPGGETYTKRTFSPRRYESKVLNSYGHPVPVVAGQLQKAGEKYAAKIVSTSFSDDRDEVVIDIAAAYPERPAKLTRTVVFERAAAPRVSIRDDVAFDAPAAFESPFVTCAKVERAADGRSLVVTGGKGKAKESRRVRVDVEASGGDWEWVEDTIENPDHPSAHRLAVRFKNPVAKASVVFKMAEVPFP